MMKYLEKAPANVAAIFSCMCWKPSWKMLLFLQFCSKINNNTPPFKLWAQCSCQCSLLAGPFLRVELLFWTLVVGLLLWVAGIPWDCGLVTLRVVSSVSLEPENSWPSLSSAGAQVWGISEEFALGSFKWGQTQRCLFIQSSLMPTQGRLQSGAWVHGLGAQLQNVHPLGLSSALMPGLGCRMAVLWWRWNQHNPVTRLQTNLQKASWLVHLPTCSGASEALSEHWEYSCAKLVGFGI